MRLQLVCSSVNSRLRYAAHMLFEQVLGLELTVLETYGGFDQNLPVVFYGNETRSPALPFAGVLSNEDLPALPDVLSSASAFDAALAPDELSFDPLIAAFYALTIPQLYELSVPVDTHGRYDFKQLYPYANGLHQRPVVHEIAECVWRWLSRHYPQLKRSKRDFSAEVTLDIDQPWRYLNKQNWVQVGGLLRNISDKAEFRTRWQVLSGKRNDPNDTHVELRRRLANFDTTVFFLLNGTSNYDNRFRSDQPEVQQLVASYEKAGTRIGIHPSYGTGLQLQQYQQQLEALQGISTSEVRAARMHYVMFRLPETYRTAVELGIHREYTTLAPHANGFLHGMCVPFPWYDLDAEVQTPLMLHPTHAMDRTHLTYNQQSPEQSVAEVQQIIEQIKKHGGKFCWLLHNEILSDFGEWQGWRAYFDGVLDLLD